MKTALRVREITGKPERTLREMGIQKGQTVLDYDPNEFTDIFAKGNLFTLIEQRGEGFRFKRD